MVEQGFDRKNPYVSGIVELEGDARISARITGVDSTKPAETLIGLPVNVDIVEFGEWDGKKTYLAFRMM
ncbi:MAG TPA: OB-fold domain-containing protein [Anaerolineales bacterium]|nr:OB-fold domain-containing protein [Anaerolineales bacterium]